MRLQPSSARQRHLRPMAPVQFPPEPQVSLNQNTSISSNRPLGSALADTNSTSSGTSAAAESSLPSVSSVSDRRGQQELSISDGRRRPPENSSAEGKADPTTEVQEVVPDKGPITNGKKLSTLSKHPLIERLLLFTCSDLAVENPATRPNQSGGMVPKVYLLSDNLHLGSQPINNPPHYSEWNGNKLAQSLPLTLNAIIPVISGTWNIHRAPASPEVGSSIREHNLLPLGQAAALGLTAPLAEHIQSNSTPLSTFASSDSSQAGPSGTHARIDTSTTQPSRPQHSFISPASGNESTHIAIADNIKPTKMYQGLQKLTKVINASVWLRDHEPEPRIGHPNCPPEAEQYGILGASVYTVFVEVQNEGTYGCKHEKCHFNSTRSLDDAVRHQRYHHFNHLPYACIPPSGARWYVSSYPVRWSNPS